MPHKDVLGKKNKTKKNKKKTCFKFYFNNNNLFTASLNRRGFYLYIYILIVFLSVMEILYNQWEISKRLFQNVPITVHH